MNIICHKNDLLKGINTVLKAVSSRTTLPILEGILFQAINGNIYLVATDLEIGIKTNVSGQIIEEGTIVLSSKIIPELIKKLPDDDITIETDINNKTKINCLNSEFNIQGQSGNEFPELPQVINDQTINLPKDLFKSMIKETIFSVAENESIPILTGALLEINENQVKLVALDGYRLALRKGKINSTQQSLKEVVPARTLNEIYRILSIKDNDINISYTGNQILFKIGQTSIISRLLEGDFINYQQIIPNEKVTIVKIKTRDLLQSCERAALLAREGKNNLIKMDYRLDELSITSNAEIGKVQEEVFLELEGQPLKIAFNSKYFIDILKVISEEEILLEFTNSVSPCVIRPIDGDYFTYLILPVRFIEQ